MATLRIREESVNTQLAVILSTLGVSADAETIHASGSQRPDVLFEMRGLRAVIEGKFGDVANAERLVLNDARNRVRSGIAHIAVAVIYPAELRSTQTAKLRAAIESSLLRFRIVAETHESEDWYEGSPATLMESARRLHESLVQDDIVESTAKSLNVRLQNVAQLWIGQTGACDRLSKILGIFPPKKETADKARARRETAAKVSALVLANAFIFQEQLTRTNPTVPPLQVLEAEDNILEAAAKHWRRVWQEVNYIPIFQLAERVLNELPSGPQSATPVRTLLAEAKAICSRQAALRHDLMGRIYHWLLHHAKFLGTYYTSVPGATLLLKLALAAGWGDKDFGDADQLAKFRVADLACGTGTLLMASAQAISDAYIKSRASTGRPLEDADLSILHRHLMESILYGYDVLPSAVHLTASTLAMLAPEVAFVNMNLFVMPMGAEGKWSRLGSLDFLTTDRIQTQMTLDDTNKPSIRVGASSMGVATARVPQIDLCVMNPPFVRSVGGNLLFGSLPDERGQMQKELKKRIKKIGANATSGLGSVFLALADRHIKIHGRIAFVLPAAIVSGEAWGPSRNLIASKYHLETVVSSHDSERWNFSENTDLSEVLFIARRLKPGDERGRTMYISLWRNPRTIYEAMDIANRIVGAGKPAAIEEPGTTTIQGGTGKLGEMITLPAVKGEENWTGALFAQADLLRVHWTLRDSRLIMPGAKRAKRLPLCRLDQIGSLGPDRKRISEGFKYSEVDWSPYPAFFGHDSEKVRKIRQSPNGHLVVRLDSPRGPDYGAHLWERAGDILLVERLWPVTQSVLAVGFDNPTFGNTWWSFKSDTLTPDQRAALLVWLNSSLSMLLYYGSRVVTRSAWMQMKQPAWQQMPVLNVVELSPGQIATIREAYNALGSQTLMPLAQLDADPVRIKIDAAISKALALPELDLIRQLLKREAGLTAKRSGTEAIDDEEDELIA